MLVSRVKRMLAQGRNILLWMRLLCANASTQHKN